jgi:hypothetical protein
MLRGLEVDQLRIGVPTKDTVNPRLQAIFALGQINQLMEDTLEHPDQVRSSDRFEILVAWLFHACGFQTMLTGAHGMGGADAPDVLAFDPYSGHALVIEVTARDPLNNDKLVKLRRRADSIKEWLGGTAPHAIVAAPARDTFLEPETREAAGLGIVLLPRPKLRLLRESAQNNDLPSDVVKNVILR